MTDRWRPGARLFATAADEPRARRATDVVLLVAGLAGLALTSAMESPPSGFARALATFAASLPDLLTGMWQLAVDVLVVLAVTMVAAALVRRRLALARDLVLAVAVAVAASLLLGRLVEGSWPAMWDGVRSAAPPPWYPSPRVAVPAAVVVTPVPLPLGPVYVLQLAVSYVNLAVPSAAGRIAVTVRFFQRHGVTPGQAVTVGALDGVTGFVVQASLLTLLLLVSPVSLDLQLDADAASGAIRLLVLVVALAAAAIAVVLAVAPWRRTVLGWARHYLTEALVAVRGLRSTRRLAMLLGGNLVSEVLFATTLATFTAALGFRIGLGEALLVNIGVTLLAGVMPIPGGIGVAEGGLTFGLISAGMPDESAFGAAILYRLATFYLPPAWGFFAMRWLQRNQHL